MAGDLKNFPPSALKLERLRSEGIVPGSTDVLIFAAVLGLFVGIFVLSSTVLEELLAYTRSVFIASSLRQEADLRSGLLIALRSISAVVLPLCCAVLLIGMLQNKFLFVWKIITFNMSRLFVAGQYIGRFFERIGSSLLAALRVCCWLGVCLLLLRYISLLLVPAVIIPDFKFAELLLSMNSSSGAIVGFDAYADRLLGPLKHLFILSLAFSFFVGILSYFIAVLAFYREHRMTRQEVESENRELEHSPELITARNEYRDEAPE